MIGPDLPIPPPVLREPQRDVLPELRPLATYAAQRALQGRPLLEDLRPLRAADDTVRETRATLWAGRGNVVEDLISTDFDSSRRTSASRAMANRIVPDPNRTASQFTSLCAGFAVAAGAGNCGEHADIALRLHAGRLGAGQVADKVTQPGVDHVWVEQSPAPGENGPTIVIDPWMRGPAVVLEDAHSLHGLAQPMALETVSANEGPALRAAFQAAVAQTAAYGHEIELHVRSMDHAGATGVHVGHVFEETDVLSVDLQADASAAASQNPMPLSVLVSTVAAARELGANVRGAAAFAHDVIAALAPHPEP